MKSIEDDTIAAAVAQHIPTHPIAHTRGATFTRTLLEQDERLYFVHREQDGPGHVLVADPDEADEILAEMVWDGGKRLDPVVHDQERWEWFKECAEAALNISA